MVRSWRCTALTVLAFLLVSCGGDSTGPVTLSTISLDSSAVTLVGVQGGGAPAPKTVQVKSGSSAVVVALSVGTIVYGAGASGWLAASLNTTVSPATLTLTASTGSLASGNYSATVSIISANATNSPQNVTVNLRVLGSSLATTLASAGQSATFLASSSFATQLAVQAGSQYLIAVVNTNPSFAITEDFTLAGGLLNPAATASVAAPPANVSAAVSAGMMQRPLAVASADSRLNVPTMRRLESNHLQILDVSRQNYAYMRRTAAPRAAGRLSADRIARPLLSVSQTIGTVNKVYVRNSIAGACTSVDSIGARTVAVGAHVIVLADTNRTKWPDAQRPDSAFYQTFANEYDAVTWPHILNNIGDPLAYDSQLSSTGKVTVTITPVLNTLGGGVVAFVNPCDFFPTVASGADANRSNFTETFYSLTPSTTLGLSIDAWERELRATASHETKHIVAIASRIIANSPDLDEIWLEEGLAQESSEIWMRTFNQATWKGHATFAQTVGCELSLGPTYPCNYPSTGKPYTLVFSHLPFMFDYLNAESQTNSEGLGKDTPANYGAGWTIARWATDQYAGSDEAAFIKSLISESTLIGLPNLQAHTGQPIPLLLLYWNMATATFGPTNYTAADPRITFPSFDLADIFNVGQTALVDATTKQPRGLFTDSGTPVYPIQPIALTAGSISKTVSGVRGTAGAFLLLSATADGVQALELESGTGGTISASSALRVGIIRVK